MGVDVGVYACGPRRLLMRRLAYYSVHIRRRRWYMLHMLISDVYKRCYGIREKLLGFSERP